MFTKMQKICIFAFIIMPILVFGDSKNGFVSQHPTTIINPTILTTSTTIAPAETPTTVAPLTVTIAKDQNPTVIQKTLSDEVQDTKVATATTRTTTTTAETRAASLNAPAHIDDNASSLFDEEQYDGKTENSRNSADKTFDSIAMTTVKASTTKTTTTSTIPNIEGDFVEVTKLPKIMDAVTEMQAMNESSKSDMKADEQHNEGSSDRLAENRNIEATTIKAKILGATTLKPETTKSKPTIELHTKDSDLSGSIAMPAITEELHHTKLLDEQANEQEATTTAKLMKGTVATEFHSTFDVKPTAASAEKMITATRAVNKDKGFVDGKRTNPVYRIKLAEILTDEFHSGHEQNDASAEQKDTSSEKSITENEKDEKVGDVKETKEQAQHDPSNNDKVKIEGANMAGGKLNIVDLYPMKMEDFNPIIRDSNTKLLKERTVFKALQNEDEYRQNLMPNEVEMQEHAVFATDNLDAKRRLLKQKLLTVTKAQQAQSNSGSTEAQQASKQNDGMLEEQKKSSTLEQSMMRNQGDSISDFTGKLLAEQDGVITEIEQKFRLNGGEYPKATDSSKISLTSIDGTTQSNSPTTVASTTTSVVPQASTLKRSSVNHKIYARGHDFIDRRVKKSFAFPMHHTAAAAVAAASVASDDITIPHIDFANTKFFTDDMNGNPLIKAKNSNAMATNTDGHGGANGAIGTGAGIGKVPVAGAIHPEFSTTKFYNSKELYNEMLLHNKQKQLQAIKQQSPTASSSILNTASVPTTMPGASQRFATLRNINQFATPPTLKTSATKTTSTSSSTLLLDKQATLIATKTTMATNIQDAKVATQMPQTKKYEKKLKGAKLLLKAILPIPTKATGHFNNANFVATAAEQSTTLPSKTETASASGATTSANTAISQSTLQPLTADTTSEILKEPNTDNDNNNKSDSGDSDITESDIIPAILTTTLSASSAAAAAEGKLSTKATKGKTATITSTATNNPMQLYKIVSTNPTRAASKPLVRPRVLSRLQEKINSLDCELQNVPEDSHLWRGNETHELLLPIMKAETCQNQQEKKNCDITTSTKISWEGEAEIQSGDILIVEINDALLSSENKNYTSSAHNTQVYQVTRSGHEHCDVTEGILLDITPLVVDGRKLVTLYDKDLTEGVNLLIVVSELWGSQCVRLKVTTKTDNCGENADCSGKGVCYSDPVMEEYECQCCGGFAGPHCEEIDACTPSPCTNNGICVDLSQGHEGNSYQCLCPYGYTGKNCQYESDPCNPTECMNGGTCVGNSTHFRCDCAGGYTGPLCQHSLNECESSPCVHGICVDQEDGFRCFCQPGFAGELCNFEYNECESNPCQNGGECIDHIGSYECRCTKGYTGNRCQIKVDFCANKPCPDGHRCIDHGNDFSCECPGGRNGPDCNQMARACTVNPCTHGGTCWSSGESFYCACRPGYTGTLCEDEFVVETVVSSSEFIVDDANTRNFNDKSFGSSMVLKSPIELHNAYFAAGVLAAAIFIVGVVVAICHCKVNQTYRKFSTRTTSFFPIIGFGRRPKLQNKFSKHWLSGKGLGGSNNPLRSSTASSSLTTSKLRGDGAGSNGGNSNTPSTRQQQGGQLHERPFQRHLAMNLENDMYYTVDFSENSQHSPLIQ